MRSQSHSAPRRAASLEHFEPRPLFIIAEAATHDATLPSAAHAALLDSLLATQSLLVMTMSPHANVAELEAFLATHLLDGLVRDAHGTHVDTTTFALEDVITMVARGALHFDQLAVRHFCDVVTASARGRMVRSSSPQVLKASVALACSALLGQPDTAALTHELTGWLTGTQVACPRDLSHLGSLVHALEAVEPASHTYRRWRDMRPTIRHIIARDYMLDDKTVRAVIRALDRVVAPLQLALQGRPRAIVRAEREIATALLLGSLVDSTSLTEAEYDAFRVAIPRVVATGSFVGDGRDLVPFDVAYSIFRPEAIEHFVLVSTNERREAALQLALAIALVPPVRQDLRLQLMAWLTDWGCARAPRASAPTCS